MKRKLKPLINLDALRGAHTFPIKSTRKNTKRVLKKYNSSVNLETAKKEASQINEYYNLLNQNNIPVIKTKVFVSRGFFGHSVKMVQPFIKKENILKTYLKNCSKEEAIKRFGEIISLSEKASKNNLGLDFLIKNFAIIDSKITLIDLYPPYTPTAKQENGLVNKRKITNSSRIKSIFFPKQIKEKLARNFLQRYDINEMKRTFLNQFLKQRPELENEFRNILK